MSRIQCFFIERTGRMFVYKSADTWSTVEGCPCNEGKAHRAKTPAVEGDLDSKAYRDLRYPKVCECGYQFTDTSNQSGGSFHEWRRTDTGEIVDHPFPVGAMFEADWLEYDGMPAYGAETQESPMRWWKGPDNRILAVMTPGGEWIIDSRASNCTMPADNSHRCWVRHGEPPNLTVDKNGHTCAAGAGSIQCGNYHGFLRNGFLEES